MLAHRTEQAFDIPYRYSVCFTRRAFSPENALLAELMHAQTDGMRARALFVIDSNVAHARPELIESVEQYARAHANRLALAASPIAIRGGETGKQQRQDVETIYNLARECRLGHHGYVVAVGARSLLDAAAYATATAHRGIRLVRMPSTALAQNDAGTGIESAAGRRGRENVIGTLAPLFAVVNDFDLLSSVPADALRAGIGDALEVALLRDASFFAELRGQRFELAMLAPRAMEPMILRCAALHLAQIREAGDPFEQRGAHPLSFGRWLAHPLEDRLHGPLPHGEAVAIGMALDTLHSRRLGLIDDTAAILILATMSDLGFALDDASLDQLDELDIDRALDDLRAHFGGRLRIRLLDRIGQSAEVNQVDPTVILACVAELRAWRQAVPRQKLAPERSMQSTVPA